MGTTWIQIKTVFPSLGSPIQWEGFCFVLVFWIFVCFLFSVCPKQPGALTHLLDTAALQQSCFGPFATYQNSDCSYTSVIPGGKTTTSTSCEWRGLIFNPPTTQQSSQSWQCLPSELRGSWCSSPEPQSFTDRDLPQLLQKFSTNPVSRPGLLPIIEKNKH